MKPGVAWQYDHEIAFMPGVPWLMRLGGQLIQLLRRSETMDPIDAVLGGAIITNLVSLLAPVELYRLTRVTFPHMSPSQAAKPALIMAACTPSPPSLIAPYTEAVYAPLSLMTARLVREGKWGRAAITALIATYTRANGFLLAGFFIYDLLVLPLLQDRRIPQQIIYRTAAAVIGVAAAIAPFIYTQWEAHARLCPSAPFCSSALPLAYSHVQAKYWNNGWLQYWTVQQIPNFIISMPVYAAGVCAVVDARKKLTVHALPHYILHSVILALLFFFSNVQIALRFATALPVLWWWVADRRHSAAGRYFIMWAQLWGYLSCVLWAAFLPPA
ncbi:hypothetical protein E3P99_00661 [Wallemia hederae]|uniref:GPI mannosyltransferase 2 n=1 Tax=Wallemia hederae TaxID=1540922 RepID=A0A4T0FUA6_9BASI|nr:hypothetical protein E3P99_00661 [Wallemia hederae]